MPEFAVISPIDGSVVARRKYAAANEIAAALARARQAQRDWHAVPLAERMRITRKFTAAMRANKDELARELARQMGRPVRVAPLEIERMAERAEAMAALAPDALADLKVPDQPGFTRFITKEPLGIVLVVAPWNYPYLTAVNAVVPAILAGNAVLLKHASQTPLVAERFAQGFAAAGLPEGVFQALHLTHGDAEKLIAAGAVDFVAFTGSVGAGHEIARAAAQRLVGVGLELGGKDPAYVRADAAVEHAVENLVDGAFFNSGQSCCAVERIYVDARIYERFVEAFVALTRQYVLGDPLKPETTLGPMVRAGAADFVRGQIDEAVRVGARALIERRQFTADKPGTPYLAPQVLVDVDHRMRVMTEESFGPVIGIMKVKGDEEAVRLMNDSRYGLTASIWTRDEGAALALGRDVATGTLFMNRCDYLDPELAWTGVKESGRGVSLSRLGFDRLTRPKSFHLRKV